jgi:hypothetical protein
MIDHLEEDFIQIPSQKYALISVVSPTSKQKHNVCGLKIRGVFATKEDAEHYVKRLMQADDTFDVYLVEMYKWLPIPPDNDMIDDKVYQEEMLNEIIQGHKESQLQAKQHFEERKKESMEIKSVDEAGPSTPIDNDLGKGIETI